MKPFILLLTGVSLVCAKSMTIGTKIEPLAEIEQSGSFADSGKSDFSLHRAQISVELERSISSIELTGEFSIDPTEKVYSDMIHDGSINLKFSDPLSITVGRNKIPFGRNASIGSSKLPTIYRSWTAEHLEKELGVSGYREGCAISGSVLEKKLSYMASLYRTNNDQRDGFSADRITALPVFSVEANPFEWIDFRWDMTLPLAAISKENGSTETMRTPLHSFSINGRAPRLYEGSVELFFGPDTADGAKLKAITEDYMQNISFSMLSLHEISVPVHEKVSLFTALGVEYCNGLNKTSGIYKNRDFYWAGTAVVGAKYGKLLRFQLSVDDQFDNEFHSIDHLRLASQLSLNGEIKIHEETK